jgi:hypothetical protein
MGLPALKFVFFRADYKHEIKSLDDKPSLHPGPANGRRSS